MEKKKVLGHTENTMFKVYDALQAAGLTRDQARDCITDMQNKGLYFREMVDLPAPMTRAGHDEGIDLPEPPKANPHGPGSPEDDRTRYISRTGFRSAMSHPY